MQQNLITMIKFFRKVRQNLLNEGKTTKYFKYAIGEIILVVIGILIALQVNNWNEEKKHQKELQTKLYAVLGDMRENDAQIKAILADLERQNKAAEHIIPIMESEQKYIQDSLRFIMDFNSFTTTPIFTQRNNTWDFLNSNGIVSELKDQELVGLLQDYYNYSNDIATNFTNSANPVRLELRQLKYELFKNSEHRKFFPTRNPIVPNKQVYEAVLNDTRVLPLCRFIGSTATYFGIEFKNLDHKATIIIKYLETHYKPMEL
jgi:hypothetical protein